MIQKIVSPLNVLYQHKPIFIFDGWSTNRPPSKEMTHKTDKCAILQPLLCQLRWEILLFTIRIARMRGIIHTTTIKCPNPNPKIYKNNGFFYTNCHEIQNAIHS